ncbi:hypothetical protein LSAT2_025625 [Lamellibrachia satsuma]|nr:hypothetical protein LSAT2_025625 [Lamellibrachia satsuma]
MGLALKQTLYRYVKEQEKNPDEEIRMCPKYNSTHQQLLPFTVVPLEANPGQALRHAAYKHAEGNIHL